MKLIIAHQKISSGLLWWILAIVINLVLALVLVKYFFTIGQANLLTSTALSGQNATGWSTVVQQSIEAKRPAAINYNEAASLQPSLGVSLIKIFRSQDNLNLTVTQMDNLYDLDKPLAGGWIITSDGWLISSADLENWSELVAVSSDHRIYKINQKTVDPLTKLFFYRLAGASNLAPVKLGEVGWSRPGQLLYDLDNHGSLQAVWLERITAGRDTIIMDDNVLWYRWQFSDVWPDSAVFNGQGDLFGLVDDQKRLVPANYIKSGLNSLLASGNFKRISFGLSYVDLNGLSTEHVGLLINQVIASSSAATAGIKPGDILLSIDEINLNGEIALNEILQGYYFGDRASLIIQRSNQNRQINCQF
jgi:hypothetical protein